MAIYMGVILGGFGGYMAEDPNLGWRMAFTACGVFGMLYSVPLLMILRDASSKKESLAAPNTSIVEALGELLTNWSFILLVLYFTLPAIAGWIVRDWMPTILRAQFGIGQGHAGVTATLYWQSAAIIGAIIGGLLADRWVERNDRGRIFVSAIGMALIVPAIFGMGSAGTLYASIASLILFGFGWGFFDGNNMPILSQIVRPHLRATGYGIMNFVSISCGGLVDWGFGVLRDQQVSLSLIFGVTAGAAIFSVFLVLLIVPNKKLSELDPIE
jgi:MFS family permease